MVIIKLLRNTFMNLASTCHGCFGVDIYGYLNVQLPIYVKMILLAHYRTNIFKAGFCYDPVSLRLSIDNSMHSNSLSTNPNQLLTCLSHFNIRRNVSSNHVLLNSLRVHLLVDYL